ncbi:MAG: DVU0150 family protein [Thermodesulfobacteriota bacterium]
MRRILTVLPLVVTAAAVLVPDLVVAAGGKAEMLIVVADKRVVDWSVSKWWVDLYNRDPFLFGVWCTIFTGLLGVTLGLITDQIMKATGLDLTSRKIVEH